MKNHVILTRVARQVARTCPFHGVLIRCAWLPGGTDLAVIAMNSRRDPSRHHLFTRSTPDATRHLV